MTRSQLKHEKLQAFLEGTLGDQESREVIEQTEHSPELREALQELSHDEHLVRRLRETFPVGSILQEPDLAKALAIATGERSGDETIVQKDLDAQTDDPWIPRFSGAAVTEAGRPSFDNNLALRHRQLRDYTLLEKLGEGGMGAVYRAIHTRLEKTVAVKVLSDHRLKNANLLVRFSREMKAVGKLDHPNIVRATDAGEVDGTHFLVMEYVPGKDLNAIIELRGPLAIPDACEVIRQTALGLQHAHEHGLVHRDLKPANLMLTIARKRATSEGVKSNPGDARAVRDDDIEPTRATIKILDFGLARLQVDETTGELTSDNQVMGTVDYMAPEQATNTHSVDIRADLYSLGCTLYKLLTGRAPFGTPQYASNSAKLVAHVTKTADPVTSIRKDVSPKLASILDKLLAKNKGDRFATPGDLAAALEPFCREANLAALLIDRKNAVVPGLEPDGRRALQTSTGSVASSDAQPPVPPRNRSWTRIAEWSGGMAALLLGITIVITITNRDGSTIKQTLELPATSSVKVEVNHNDELDRNRPEGDKPEISAAKMPEPANPTRHVAEWVLRRGGWLKLDHAPSISSIDQLPNHDFSITHIRIDGNAPLTNGLTEKELTEELRILPGLKTELTVLNLPLSEDGFGELLKNPGWSGIQYFWLCGISRSGRVLKHLRNLTSIVDLWLEKCDLTDADLADLKELRPTLLILMGNPRVTGEGMIPIGEMTSLRRLKLQNTSVDDQGMAHLRALTNLEDLTLDGTRVTPAGLEHLASCKSISTLLLCDLRETDECLIKLPRLFPKLANLVAGYNKSLTSRGLNSLVDAPNLQSLDVAGSPLGDADLESLGKLTQVKKLVITQTGITAAGVQKLRSSLPNCQIISDHGTFERSSNPPVIQSTRKVAEWVLRRGGELVVNGMRVTLIEHLPTENFVISDLRIFGNSSAANGLTEQELIDNLRDLPSLTHKLLLTKLSLTEDGFGQLVKNPGWSRVGSVTLVNISMSGQVVAKLRHLTQLEALGLDSCDLKDADLAALKDLRPATLSLIGNRQITSAAMNVPGEMKSLKDLDLRSTSVSDSGLAHLRQLTNLEKLNISRTQVTPAGLDQLEDCKSLSNLQISALSPMDDFLIKLPTLFPKLSTLNANVWGDSLTAKGLKALAELPNLQSLHVEFSNLGDADVESLGALAHLKTLSIQSTSITAAGVEKLRKALPQCQIISDHGTFEPSPNLPAKKTTRQIAEWALRRGSHIYLNGQLGTTITSIEQLPAGDFEIGNLRIWGDSPLAEGLTEQEVVENLRDLPNISNDLFLGNISLTEEGFGQLTKNARWTMGWLAFGRVSFNRNALANLRHFPKLAYLAFDRTEVTDADLADLEGLRLNDLDLHANGRITSAGMIPVGRMKSLKGLRITNSSIGDDGLARLRELTNLEHLRLSTIGATPAGLDYFSNCKSISKLKICVLDPMDDCLFKLPSLFPNLSDLDAAPWNETLTSKGLKPLAELRNLESLNVGDSTLGDADVEALTALTKLKMLDITRTKFTVAGIKKLRMGLPKCQLVSDHGTFEPAP